MKPKPLSGLLLFLLTVPFVADTRAQWTTETFALKAGWTAIYLHLDVSHTTLDSLVGSDPGNPIEEIWLWAPTSGSMQFYDNPQLPTGASTQWLRWDRYWGGSSSLQRLPPNVACLVRIRSDVPSYTWTIKGRPAPPQLSWTSNGLNFIGFSTPRTNPPSWGSFLGPDRSLHSYAEIYHYPGGAFGDDNPARLLALRTTPARRGQGYWVRAEEHNRYFGPFELQLQNAAGIRFFEDLAQYRFRLTNATGDPLTITATLLPSEDPPPGQDPVVGVPPLIVRGELDMTDLTYGFSRLSQGAQSWTLSPKGQPGSDAEIVLGLDRALMLGETGDVFAGILRLTDSRGHSQYDLPVSAVVASAAGLWVGNALVFEVRQNLGGDPGGEDPSDNGVSRPFPLRLIVHNDEDGNSSLMQRVYVGHQSSERVVIARTESVLQPSLISEARRISSAHLPWSENNVSWNFSGGLREGADVTAVVQISYDDNASNPFVHTYHPDHDNMGPTYKQQLPQGYESFGVTRLIRLVAMPPGDDFAAITASGARVSGLYEETLILHGKGGAAREFQTSGGFALNRISDLGGLTEE